MSLKEGCPCCATLKGDKARMKNGLCKDCSDNLGPRTEWGWYEIQHSLMSMHWVRYVVTAVMSCNAAYMLYKGLDFGGVVQVVGMAVSCFVMWKSFNGLKMAERIDASRQKMFLLKLSGETERKRVVK